MCKCVDTLKQRFNFSQLFGTEIFHVEIKARLNLCQDTGDFQIHSDYQNSKLNQIQNKTELL